MTHFRSRDPQIIKTAQGGPCDHADLRALVKESTWFVKISKEGVEEAPLQVYSSALVFAPEKSIVKQMFISLCPRWIQGHWTKDDHWNARIMELREHYGRVAEAMFSVDGERLACLVRGGTLSVWNTATGELLSWSKLSVKSVDISPRNELVWGDEMGNVELWPRLEERNRRRLMTGAVHGGPIASVVFSPDGSHLASVDLNGVVIVRYRDANFHGQQLHQKRLLLAEKTRWQKSMISFSPKVGGHQFLAVAVLARNGRRINVWRLRSGGRSWKLHQSFKADSQILAGIVLIGDMVACLCHGPDELRIWKVTEPSVPFRRIPITVSENLDSCRLAQVPGTLCITAPSEEGCVGLYDLNMPTADGFHFNKLEDSECLTSLCFSADGKLLAGVRSRDDTICLWDTRSAQCVAVVDEEYYGGISLCPAGNMLAVISGGGTQLYDCELLRQQYQTKVEEEMDRRKNVDIAVSADGQYVAATMRVGPRNARHVDMDLWETQTSTRQRIHTDIITKFPLVAFSPTAPPSLAVFGSTGCQIYWDLDGNRPSRTFDIQHEVFCTRRGVGPGVFSTDGTLFSFACKECCRIVMLRVQPEVGSRESTFFLSLPGGDFQSLVPCNTRSFHVVVKLGVVVKLDSEDGEHVWFEAVKFRLNGDQVEVLDTRWLPDAASQSNEGFDSIVYSSSHQKVALERIGLLTIFNAQDDFSSETYHWSAEFTICGAKFCAQGRCLLLSWQGNLRLPKTPIPDKHPCICGNIPVFLVLHEEWIFWEGKPFLYLPPSRKDSELLKLFVRNGTVAYQTEDQLFWLRLGNDLSDLLMRQDPMHDVDLLQKLVESEESETDLDYVC